MGRILEILKEEILSAKEKKAIKKVNESSFSSSIDVSSWPKANIPIVKRSSLHGWISNGSYSPIDKEQSHAEYAFQKMSDEDKTLQLMNQTSGAHWGDHAHFLRFAKALNDQAWVEQMCTRPRSFPRLLMCRARLAPTSAETQEAAVDIRCHPCHTGHASRKAPPLAMHLLGRGG
jgi:hypothetical protein